MLVKGVSGHGIPHSYRWGIGKCCGYIRSKSVPVISILELRNKNTVDIASTNLHTCIYRACKQIFIHTKWSSMKIFSHALVENMHTEMMVINKRNTLVTCLTHWDLVALMHQWTGSSLVQMHEHYNDVIMGTITSQITSIASVYSTV